MQRRALIQSLPGLALASAFPATGRAQQAFPAKPVRLVVPYPPGGSVDPVARLLGQKLGDIWGQQVVVDNKPGASTIIGTDAVAKAPADGYTLLLTSSTHVSNSLLFAKLPYDNFKDFAPVSTLYRAEFVLVVNPALGVNTLAELTALARARPGQISYASAGPGNVNHMAAELYNMMVGTKMLHVPYKGAAPLLTDLLSNQVQMYFSVPVAVLDHIQNGKLKALAITSDKRLPLLANVPTFAEAGLTGFGVGNWSWMGVWAPANTPAAIVDKVSQDIAKVLAMPDVKQRLESQGQTPLATTPQQMSALMKSNLAEFSNVIKAANIKIDQ
ncbi:Bug family tripartite tricarboxylate transporter substrate binding protein [Caenimonas aquaedulcis]|uniref:Tripartite tricarboxylate transporter substrate binding protein n=1 Tax=Caenimonas aquaedulcis TaxID=2793270 RepID=A0A931MJM5_9BURK|nr:tripartite tricarboxylate transporter substrate binding protein [Caenimonas aquaedulcis]MBG9390455.1 tripartite tricarboxylate transporter substrate binding protein [Caenimonas aquaedulcis]